MKAIFNILTVSKYEAKTLFRSWFFRIFSILALIFVFFYNFIFQTSLGPMPDGDMVALPSTIPFKNLYIINIAQAIIAVFLASDFLKRDKKLDTTEVIYMRSMTNADYVIGKTLGNIYVFLVLNIIALGMVAVFNLSSPYTQFTLMPYIYYFLIISLPTLIFILGFSFFMMSIIRNQAVTFVVLLGYIAATVFYLQKIYHYLFDYMAFNLPLTFSDFVGFASLKEIIIHRGIYVFLGLGFIGLTIMILKRLPQSNVIRKVTLVSSIVSLVMGLGLALYYIQNITVQERHRTEMLALNDKYAETPFPEMQNCNVELEHKGDEIIVKAGVEMVNTNKVPIREIILTLNPGLEITELTGAKYARELQLVKVTPDSPLLPGSSLKLNISYHGKIDESFCYLDMTRERLDLLMERGNASSDTKHAFITPSYLLLTPESNWYPSTGISYSTKGLAWLATQFTDYTLKVKTNKGLRAISQGKASDDGNGTFVFKPETKLTQISLAIGNYKTRSITVDGINYSLNYLSGHDYFDKYFRNVTDSIAPIIKDIKKSWEAKVQSVYPFKRFSMVEIPSQYCAYEHVWSGLNDRIQPETVYLPEGGYKLSSANFAMQQKFATRQYQDHNETVSPREREENYLRRFVNGTFLTATSRTFSGAGAMGGPGMGVQMGQGGPTNITVTEQANPYYLFPNYYDYTTYFKSDKYPITNRVIKAYLAKATDGGNPFMRNITGMSSSEKGNIALQDHSFAQILADQSDPDIIGSVIQTKSGFLFALMKGAVGTDKFNEFLHMFLENKQFRDVPINELNDEMRNSFKLDLDQYLPVWYNSKTLPGYIMSKIQAVKIKDEDQMKTMVSFILTNTEDAPGAITVTFRLGGGRGGGGGGNRGGGFGGGFGGQQDNTVEKTILIGAKQSKKVSYLLNRDPRMMTIDTYASHNIPSTLNQGFEKIETNEKLTGFEGEEIVPYTDGSEPSEIILDNEDPGFNIEQPVSKSLIKKLFFSSDKPEDNLKYKGMSPWNPPVDWTLITNDQFYGKQIRSAYYIKGGAGNCKAIWNLPVKEKGFYKLSVYITKVGFRGGGRGPGGGDRGPGGGSGGGASSRDKETNEEYSYTIYSDDGKDHQSVNMKNVEGGWTEIGSYRFTPGTAKVELSNLSKATRSVIVADAVKLVREN
jgi:ABC-type transport system involved in multi-copper enzyme maturation permease subunit